MVQEDPKVMVPTVVMDWRQGSKELSVTRREVRIRQARGRDGSKVSNVSKGQNQKWSYRYQTDNPRQEQGLEQRQGQDQEQEPEKLCPAWQYSSALNGPQVPDVIQDRLQTEAAVESR